MGNEERMVNINRGCRASSGSGTYHLSHALSHTPFMIIRVPQNLTPLLSIATAVLFRAAGAAGMCLSPSIQNKRRRHERAKLFVDDVYCAAGHAGRMQDSGACDRPRTRQRHADPQDGALRL